MARKSPRARARVAARALLATRDDVADDNADGRLGVSVDGAVASSWRKTVAALSVGGVGGMGGISGAGVRMGVVAAAA